MPKNATALFPLRPPPDDTPDRKLLRAAERRTTSNQDLRGVTDPTVVSQSNGLTKNHPLVLDAGAR